MNRAFKLQFLGPLALFATTLCAELAARALEYAPSSELLWFINLRMFGIFQRSYAALGNMGQILSIEGFQYCGERFQYFGLALPTFVFVLASVGLAAKCRLPLTVATHLSAAYAGFLVLSWQVGVPTTKQASLVSIPVPSGPGLYVMGTIVGTCLLSFAVTHLVYLGFVRAEIKALINWLRAFRWGHRSLSGGGAAQRTLVSQNPFTTSRDKHLLVTGS
jgi:hypothetical protein